jgi:hypothetical protein
LNFRRTIFGYSLAAIGHHSSEPEMPPRLLGTIEPFSNLFDAVYLPHRGKHPENVYVFADMR